MEDEGGIPFERHLNGNSAAALPTPPDCPIASLQCCHLAALISDLADSARRFDQLGWNPATNLLRSVVLKDETSRKKKKKLKQKQKEENWFNEGKKKYLNRVEFQEQRQGAWEGEGEEGGRHADAFRRRGVDGRIRRLDWFPRRQASTGVVRRRHVTTR